MSAQYNGTRSAGGNTPLCLCVFDKVYHKVIAFEIGASSLEQFFQSLNSEIEDSFEMFWSNSYNVLAEK